MEIIRILANLVTNPLVPRFYREAASFYYNNKLFNEANAFYLILEQKFGEKYAPTDNSDANKQ